MNDIKIHDKIYFKYTSNDLNFNIKYFYLVVFLIFNLILK